MDRHGTFTKMKVKKLIQKLNKAEFEHNLEKVKKFWFKLLKKSFKGKHTQSVK
jgi:hypothetical protein